MPDLKASDRKLPKNWKKDKSFKAPEDPFKEAEIWEKKLKLTKKGKSKE